jgi:hypothetical protein
VRVDLASFFEVGGIAADPCEEPAVLDPRDWPSDVRVR